MESKTFTVPNVFPSIDRTAVLKVAEDLQAACKSMNSAEWTSIVLGAAAKASKTTLKTKAIQLKKAADATWEMTQRYCREGVVKAGAEDAERVKEFLKGLPTRVRQTFEVFKQLPRNRQQDQVIDVMLTWIIFWASTGGIDFEGGLPDTDLALGVGNHRNLVSHTIFLGLTTEFGLRFCLELFEALYSKLPENHSRAWDASHDFLLKHHRASIYAMWAGIGFHFLKDAALLSTSTKPYVGMPAPMPMEAHKAIFAANGVACEVLAGGVKE